MIINYSGIDVRVEAKAIKHAYIRVKSDGSILMTVNRRFTSRQIEQILDSHLPKLKVQIESIRLAKMDAAALTTPLTKEFYDEAEQVFKQRFSYWLTQIESWQVTPPKLTIRAMKSRWGSYSRHTHKVTLNLWLIKAPIELLDYVIAHELSHIRHYNHGPDFYTQLAVLYPDWYESRRQLKHAAKSYCYE